ncbi:MAG: membrane protein insertion efficiency factor YidD [Pseudomonadota bacterium]
MGRVLRAVIRFYQLFISALLGPRCRHLPTCSAYADEAISRFGPWAGLWLTLSRFVRCGPFGTAGYDPVPERLSCCARWYMPWRYGYWTGQHMDKDTSLH